MVSILAFDPTWAIFFRRNEMYGDLTWAKGSTRLSDGKQIAVAWKKLADGKIEVTVDTNLQIYWCCDFLLHTIRIYLFLNQESENSIILQFLKNIFVKL